MRLGIESRLLCRAQSSFLGLLGGVFWGTSLKLSLNFFLPFYPELFFWSLLDQEVGVGRIKVWSVLRTVGPFKQTDPSLNCYRKQGLVKCIQAAFLVAAN